jgi:hypothetical protein
VVMVVTGVVVVVVVGRGRGEQRQWGHRRPYWGCTESLESSLYRAQQIQAQACRFRFGSERPMSACHTGVPCEAQ